MQKRKYVLAAGVIMAAAIYFFCFTLSVSASSNILKKGMEKSSVAALQSSLKKLGYFNAEPTGYFGDITVASVKKLQMRYGYAQDGIAGNDTLSLINRLLSEVNSTTTNRGIIKENSNLLKKGMQGSNVTALQSNLKKLGYFNTEPTGYFGDITEDSVISLQKYYKYSQDGIAGSSTLSLINNLLGKAKSIASRGIAASGSTQGNDYLMPWFSEVQDIFKIGTIATVYDIDTGASFKIKRAYGYNHADCETVTSSDTKTMKEVFGGQWSWSRRAVIIDVGGRKIAASIAGMPHAGNESKPANEYTSSRSGGYGGGTNLDTVKGNSMSGHFDVHFYGSKTHGTNKVDSAHQSAVKKAAKWAAENY